MRPTILCLALAGALAALPAHAENPLGDSAQESRVLTLADKHIPLPDGTWHLLGHTHALLPAVAGGVGAYGTMQTAVLAQERDGRIAAILEATTNTLPVRGGWGVPAECDRDDLPLVVNRYRSGYDVHCMVVGHARALDAGRATDAFDRARTLILRAGMRLPAEWVTVTFRVADRRDIVDVRFSFDPAVHGLNGDDTAAWADSPWHRGRVEGDAERLDYLAQLTEWGTRYGEVLERGVKRRIAEDETIPTPFVPESLAAATARRLAVLDGLYRDGAVDEQAYRIQRALVLEGRTLDAPPTIDPATVALWKTISYRPMVSFANVFIDYFWIGQPFAAGVLVLLQVTVNTTKFYFHELAWSRFSDGATGREVARPLDLPVSIVYGPPS